MGSRQGDLRKLLASLKKQDFQVRPRRSKAGHVGIYSPAGEHVLDLSTSPSDVRCERNSIQALRRHGYIDPSREARIKKSARTGP